MHSKLPQRFLESDPLRHGALIDKDFSASSGSLHVLGKFDKVEWNEDGTARYRFVSEHLRRFCSPEPFSCWYVVRQSSDGNMFAYGDLVAWQPETACNFENIIVFCSIEAIEAETKLDSFEEYEQDAVKNGGEMNNITYCDADGIWKALYHTVYSGTPHESVLELCKRCMHATVRIEELKGKKAEVFPEGSIFNNNIRRLIQQLKKEIQDFATPHLREIKHFGLYHSISADQPSCTQCSSCINMSYANYQRPKQIQDGLLLHAVQDAPWSAVGASLQIHKSPSTFYICRIVRWIPPGATGSRGMAPLFLVKFMDGGTEEYRFKCFEDQPPAPVHGNYAYTKYKHQGISAVRVLSFPGMKKSASIKFFQCDDYDKVDLGNEGGHLQIILATYGSIIKTNSVHYDTSCTSSIQELVTNGRIKVRGGIHTKIGDPEPGHPKKFRVWYTHETKAQRQARNEENARPVLLRFFYLVCYPFNFKLNIIRINPCLIIRIKLNIFYFFLY